MAVTLMPVRRWSNRRSMMKELKAALGLNSANSINISRLLAQICYYFEAVAQRCQEARNQLVVSVPAVTSVT